MNSWEFIEKSFNEGVSLTKISNILKEKYKESPFSLGTVSNFLKKKGYIIINHQNTVSISDEKAIELLNSGMSLEKIEKFYGLSGDCLSRRLKKQGIIIKNNQNNRPINHNVFSVIDTEEKAYWLGFLFADGCVTSNGNIISLVLADKDLNHLLKYKKFLETKNNITHSSKTKASRLDFSSAQIKKDLINLGCTTRKTLTLEPPSKIPNNLVRHFIRGYFDGDGCLTYQKNGNSGFNPIAKVISTENVLKYIIKYSNCLPGKIHLANPKGNPLVKEVNFHGKNCIDFLKYIYEDCNVYLSRKFFRYQVFKENNFAVQCRNMLNYEESKTVKAASEEEC